MDIINLPGLNVIEVKQNEAGDYGIYVAASQPPFACPHCYALDKQLYRFGQKQQKYMDLPIHAQPVVIIFQRQRYQCRQCEKTFWERASALDDDRSMTRRLIQHIRKQSLKETFTSVARNVGVLEKTVRDVFKGYKEELEAEFMPKAPRYLGLDEVHILKRSRAILTDLENRTIVDLLPDRKKPVLWPYMQRLEGRERVEAIAMDMWQPYRDVAAAFFPKAQVIVDKFHVVRTASECLEMVRKSIRADLTERQRRQLMHDRFIMLKRRKDLDMRQAIMLDAWCQQLPLLGKAYEAKEAFYDLFDAPDSGTAWLMYQEWLQQLPDELRKPFEKVIRAMTEWRLEILAYFDWRLTNATTEGLNSIVRQVDRMGRGYSFDVLRVKLLFSDGVPKAKPQRERKNTFEDMVMRDRLIEYLGADISTLIEKLERGEI